MRVCALLLLAACNPSTRVVVLDEETLEPVAGVSVVFHLGRMVVGQVSTDAEGAASFSTGDPIDISVRSTNHAETRRSVPTGERIEFLFQRPIPPPRTVEIAPPPPFAMQADLQVWSPCSGTEVRTSAGAFSFTSVCRNDSIAMIARDGDGAKLGWSTARIDGDRVELPPWSDRWTSLHVEAQNAPAEADFSFQAMPLIYGQLALLFAAPGPDLALPDAPYPWLLMARLQSDTGQRTRFWTVPGPIAEVTVDLSSMLPETTTSFSGDVAAWSIASDRLDGVVTTAIYHDPALGFWNVVVPPDTFETELPPLTWTSTTPYLIDVEALDGDFVDDYAQRAREIGPNFFPRDYASTLWRVDISTAYTLVP